MNEKVHQIVTEVQNILGLGDCTVVFDQITQETVFEETRDGSFKQFDEGIVGMDPDPILAEQKIIRILHSREPQKEDLIHELLHFKYPRWSHEEIEEKTTLLANS